MCAGAAALGWALHRFGGGAERVVAAALVAYAAGGWDAARRPPLTDVALETADVVLMGDDLKALEHAHRLSLRTLRIVRQNLGSSPPR